MNGSIRELTRRVLGSCPPEHSLALRFADFDVRMESNSRELLDRLAGYFHVFVAGSAPEKPEVTIIALEAPSDVLDLEFVDWPREGGKTGRKDTFADIEGGRVVRKVRTKMQYLLGGEHPLMFGPCLENTNQVVNFVNAQYMNRLLNEGWTLCHAAGVVHAGRGLAIAGVSGAGKSTLALQLIRNGMAFTSNDRLLIRRDGDGVRMAGVPKMPRINPGTALSNPDLVSILPEDRRASLAKLELDELWELEEKYDVDIGKVYEPDRIILNAPLTGFMVLNWHRSRSEPTAITEVILEERPDLLAAIMKSAGVFYEPDDGERPTSPHHLDESEYLEVLRGVPVFEASNAVGFLLAMRHAAAFLEEASA